MEDLTEDEMLIRAMEESLRHYEEVERPLRQLADEEAPHRNSTATRPNEVVRPPESTSGSSWPNSSGFVGQPVTKPGVTESSSASTFKPATSSRIVPPIAAVSNSSRIDPKSGPSTSNSWGNSSVAKPGPSTANSWGNSNVAKPGPSTTNSLGNSSVAKPGPSTTNSWGNSKIAKPGPFTVNSWGNSNVAKPGPSTTNSWGNSNVAKPGPSRGAGNNTLPSLWQTMGTKRAAKEQEVQDEMQTEEDDGTLQLLSDSKTLTENGFCMFTGRHWVYPTNYPERKYQLDMVQTALFHNTLVCLPTGLGKTFIAAVVMYNFYRWYPKGKIIFMAPTKPLVAQQIKACYDITGIPREHTEELTGTMNVERRTQAWKKKRVFFATPQVVANDLVAQVCPAEEVRCMVVDEAHRAQGDFAYCQVVSTLRATSTNFRLLALSATPGTDIKAVQQVLANLHISKLKIATEDSPEIAQYTHHREVEIVTVAATPELNEARDRFQIVMGQYLQPLIQNNLVSGYNLGNLTMFQMKTHLDKLSRQPPSWMSATELSRMKNLCLVCISLCHAQELLQNYGLRSFLSNIQGVLQDSKTNKVVSGYLSRDDDLLKLIHELNEKLNGKPKKEGEKTGGRPTILYGHPKLQKLQQIVADHFYDYDDRQESTRAIIFCQYRDSVEEIKNMLKVLEPVVKPMSFVGQAKSKGSVGLTQKQQLQVMRDFRSGDFNTLISTSVGEEGLDIGEVDLIVCMDANKSPIRLMQRMGRTGRKRAGKIIMLLSEGKEHKKYIDSTKKQSSISKNILNNQKLLPVLNQNSSPKMIPEGLSPKVYKTVLVIPREAKEQDIRKVMRKASSLPDLLPAFLSPAEVAKWDGTVPEFNHLETTVNSDLLAFHSLESIFEWSSQDSLMQKPPGLDLYDFLEWQRSMQGSDESPHSKDSMALAALLQLADKMTLNNPELLTQTTDLVTEVDHDALWGTLKGTKGQGRGKRGRPAKEAPPLGTKRGDIAWCLQKQGQKRVPEISLEDASDFVLPTAQKQSSELNVSLPAGISEALERLEWSIDSLQIDPETPVCQMFRRISLTSEALRKANIKHNKPDFLSLPPDINSVDTILATLRTEYEERLKVRVKQVDNDFSPDTLHQIDKLTESAPALAKRTFHCEPSTSTSAVNRDKTIPKKSPEIIPPCSPENKIIHTPKKMSDDDIKIIAEVKSPIKPYQPHKKLHDISQGMTDFLMNFDLGFEDNDCFASLDVKQPKVPQKIVTPKKNGLTRVEIEKKEEVKTSEIKGNNSSLMDFDVLGDNFVDIIPEKTESPVKTKVPEMKVETESKNIPRATSPDKPFPFSFDVLDDENDLFADIDISSWMGELEKRGYESQVRPPSTSPPPLLGSKKPQVPMPTSPSLLSSIKPKVPVKPSTPKVATKPSTSNTTPASVSKKSPDLFSEGEASPHIIKPLIAKPFSSSPIITNPLTSQSPNVAAKTSPNIFTSSSSNSSVVALKGTPTSPTSTTSTLSKSPIFAKKASPNIFASSSSNSSIAAMKGTPTSPISVTKNSIGATKTSPHIFTSSSSGSPLARLKTETQKSSNSLGDTLKLTPSSINTTLMKSPDIFNSGDTAKQKSTSNSDSPQSKVPSENDPVDLRPLKVPSKLSMKSRVLNGVRSDVQAKVQQNSTQDDDSFIEVPKRKSSERRQALILSSDESSPEKGKPRGNVDVDSSPDVKKLQQRRKIVDNDSSPDVKKVKGRRRNVDYESSPDTKKGQARRRNVDVNSSPDIRKRQGRSSSPDTTMKPSHSITISSDDESSPDTKHKRKVHIISEEESPEAIVISSDDDEFKTPVPVKASKRKSEKEHRKHAKKHKKSVKGFLHMEAEVSGDDDSGDEVEDSQMDRYDESFIKAEATQADASIDMRAQYLRSVRSPLQGHGRFKIPQLQPARGKLLSPGDHGDHDDSSYMNDSFCVDTEGEEEEEGSSEDSHAELEALEAKLEKQKTRKKQVRRDEVLKGGRAGKKRDRKSFSSQEEEVTRKKMKLNRIIVHSSSEDEEAVAMLPSSKPSPPSPPQATSTPVNHNMVRGFENDYFEDDNIDALLAAINMTQEIEEQTRKQASRAQESRNQVSVVQESKKPASRSLFNDQDRPSTSKSLRRQPDISDDEWEVPVKTSNIVEPKPGPSGSGTVKTLSLGNRVQTGSKHEVVTKPLLALKQQAKSSRYTGTDNSEDCKEIPRKTLSLASKQSVKPSDIRQESAALETRTSVPESRGMKNTLSLVKPVPTLPKLSDPSKDLERTAVVAPVVIPKAGPSTNETAASSSRPTVASNHSNQQPVGSPVIIVSTRQVVSAPKLLTILRNTHKINAKFQTLPSGIDYVVSQRLAISRMQLQDVSSYNEKSDVVLTVRAVRQQFKFAVLVLENNASRPVPEPWKEASRHSLPGAKAHRTALCLMKQVDGLKVVFTKDQAETANIIQKLALKEHQCKYGIKQYCKESCDPAFDARLKFFTHLPGVNIALALKLVHQFPVMANFIRSCSTIEGIEKTLGMNKRQAATLHQVLSKPLQ